MSSFSPALCSLCGEPLRPGARFCPLCATRVTPDAFDPLAPPRASSGPLIWILGAAVAGLLVTAIALGGLYLFLSVAATRLSPVALVAGAAGTPTESDAQAFGGSVTVPATAEETALPEIPSATYVPLAPETSVPSPAAECTDDAEFVADVTIPDGTVVNAGQSIEKTWRLRNSGSCAWDGSYSLIFTGGEQMSGASPQAVDVTSPGEEVSVTVAMIAPRAPGRHSGQWQLLGPNGDFFGTKVTVIVVVPGPPTPVPTSVPTSPPPPTTTPLPPTSCSGAPSIDFFSATATTINEGESLTLSWGLVTNASSVSIDPAVGGISTPGSVEVTPATTTTYILTAVCDATNSTQTARVTVTVGAATVHSQGTLSIPEGSKADLDAGVVGGSGPDIWFEARTANQRFVTPRNGAQIAKFGTSEPGIDDCSTAALSENSININKLPSGTFVCVLTSKGRYSQFQVTATVGPSPGTLNISFTTWN
jgi:Ig-like domain from next to BRCA1 gene